MQSNLGVSGVSVLLEDPMLAPIKGEGDEWNTNQFQSAEKNHLAEKQSHTLRNESWTIK